MASDGTGTHSPEEVERRKNKERGYGMELRDAVRVYPTPHANAATGPGRHGDGGPNLQTAVHEAAQGGPWPTPTSTGRPTEGSTRLMRERVESGDIPLDEARRMNRNEVIAEPWPTPRASPNENRQRQRTPSQASGDHGKSLAAEVWEDSASRVGVGKDPTPTASDWKGSTTEGQRRGQLSSMEPEWRRVIAEPPDGEPVTEADAIAAMRSYHLHGRWTLGLMGYPPNWCDDPSRDEPEGGPRAGWDTPGEVRAGWASGTWEDGLPRLTHTDSEADLASKLKAAGNAIVPIVAYEIMMAMFADEAAQ